MEQFQILLFSQYSFESFAPAVLTFVIFVYLVTRKKTDRAHRFLSFYFAAAFLYEAGHLVTYSLYSPLGAYGWFLAALAPFGLVFLIQFAYSFAGERCGRESRIVFFMTMILSIALVAQYSFNAIRGGIHFSETGYAPVFSSKLIPGVVFIFYLWVILIFIRNTLYAERNNTKKNFIIRFFSPATESGRSARNFALLVTLDICKVILLSLYIFFRAIPYVTIISSGSAFSLLIYSLYAVVYVRSDFHRLSARFKIIGSVFIFNILIFSTMGYVALSQFENSYDDRRIVELRYLTDGIRSRNFNAIPEDVDYIVKLTGTIYDWVYTKDQNFLKPQSIELNDFTPGRWRLSDVGEQLPSKDAQIMKRYLVQINNINYNQFIIKVDGERYGVGYNYYLYRKSASSTASILIIIAIISSAVILLAVPFLISWVKLFSSSESEQYTGHEEERSKKEEDYTVTSDTYQKIQKAVEYINQNYMYDIAREGAAEAVGMSPGRFGRAFLTCTGKKFSEYINDVRIEKAKVLLEGDASIIDIAYSVGFESLSTFSRAFNKNCGITPSAYRDQLHK